MNLNVCIIRIDSDNKVLLVKNIDRAWEFPGGKVEHKKDRYKDTENADLLKAAFREFNEEVGNNIKCLGPIETVLFENEYKTVYFVYKNQKPVISATLQSNDNAIEKIKQFYKTQLFDIPFSFGSDKKLILAILENEK